MILRRSIRSDMRDSAWAFVLPFGVAFAASSIALAQTPPQRAATVPQPPSAPSPSAAVAKAPSTPDALKQSDQDLDAALAQQRASAENQIKLRSEIEALGQDRRKFNQELIDTAARVRDVEANINTTQERLGALDGQQRLLQNSLDQRHGVIVEVLAALQRMGQQPPPALMVRPEDALTAVRTAITLGAVLPEMRAQADALAGDLADMLNLRKQIVEQRDQLDGDLKLLGREQLRMTLLIDERQKKQAVAEQALTDERQRATDLGHQVDNIKDLIAKMETGLDSTTRAAREANRAVTSDATQPDLAALSDPGRLAPAVSFADMRGHMHLPVNGVRIREFGGSDGLGGTQKGLSIATRPGGEITAPCDGWVVYAGPFRSYGQLLILNAGGGYHVLLAGMERISVDLGQFVLTGEPVAVMSGGSQASPTGVAGPKQPVLYVEFRKDGAPIDPSPWWATNEGEKVRG
jgi:septal ring factor EnvC (AmiA/AmiB activator)